VEIVERKGKGHPDSLCDAMMESVSIALTREYLREFGPCCITTSTRDCSRPDGRKEVRGGRVIKPMELTIGDRATFSVGGKKIPVAEIAVKAVRDWVRGNMRFIDPRKHLACRVGLLPGSEELTDIFARSGEVRSANDTSAAVGYYP